MNRLLRTFFLFATATALAVASASAAPQITAMTRPCGLSVGGVLVRSLLHGQRTIIVRDQSRSRFFRLTGKGVTKATRPSFVGTVTWRVALKPGIYRYTCSSELGGAIRVR
jgi:hypothetical protein